MITQLFLDFLAIILGGVIVGLPPLPAEFSGAIGTAAAQAAALAPTLATLGPVVPFSAIAGALALFPVAVGYWLTVSAIRIVLWLFDR